MSAGLGLKANLQSNKSKVLNFRALQNSVSVLDYYRFAIAELGGQFLLPGFCALGGANDDPELALRFHTAQGLV